MIRESVAISAAALMSVALASSALSQSRPDISGHWRSASPEAEGPVHATREFQFTPDTWSVIFRAYADASASKPLFKIEVAGVYVIGAPSAAVPNAHEGIFPATRRVLTAESAEGAAMFAGMGCTLDVGIAKPLTTAGCGFLPSLMQAMGEYDLVSIQGGQLFLGDRTGDLTKARPVKLTPHPLVKK